MILYFEITQNSVFCRIKLSYRILNEWYLTVLPSFSIKWRYTNIEPVLNSIPIKLHRVFLSHNVVTVSSHYLIFHQHMYARQLSNRSILHAGRYLNDKEIATLGPLLLRPTFVEADFSGQIDNGSDLSYKYWSHISSKI